MKTMLIEHVEPKSIRWEKKKFIQLKKNTMRQYKKQVDKHITEKKNIGSS